jgi:hypothetical protein
MKKKSYNKKLQRVPHAFVQMVLCDSYYRMLHDVRQGFLTEIQGDLSFRLTLEGNGISMDDFVRIKDEFEGTMTEEEIHIAYSWSDPRPQTVYVHKLVHPNGF